MRKSRRQRKVKKLNKYYHLEISKSEISNPGMLASEPTILEITYVASTLNFFTLFSEK